MGIELIIFTEVSFCCLLKASFLVVRSWTSEDELVFGCVFFNSSVYRNKNHAESNNQGIWFIQCRRNKEFGCYSTELLPF